MHYATLTPSLTTSDLQASLRFYRDILGFELVRTFDEDGEVRGAQLRSGSFGLFLGQDDFKKGRDRRKGQGLRFHLTYEGDLDQLAADVEARGGSLTTPVTDQPWGTRDFSVTDPDGFNLTVGTPWDGSEPD